MSCVSVGGQSTAEPEWGKHKNQCAKPNVDRAIQSLGKRRQRVVVLHAHDGANIVANTRSGWWQVSSRCHFRARRETLQTLHCLPKLEARQSLLPCYL